MSRPSPLPGLLRLSPALPFVGRSEELAALRVLRDEAAREGGRVAILHGEPGSGKTRLARQVAEGAAAAGALVLYGACDPSLGPPYQAVAEAFEQLADHDPETVAAVARGPRGAALAALLPDLPGGAAGAHDAPDPTAARHSLHAAVTDALVLAARTRPVVLVLDDLHWAGAPTLLLLRHLARSTAEARLLVLGTTRDVDAESAPDLADALAELRRLDGVVRVSVGGLDATAIEELLRTLAGPAAAGRAGTIAPGLATLTGGNAFLVAELAQHLADAGLLDEAAQGDVTAAGLEAVGVPQGVREVIGQRIARMSPETREVLELVAVAPRGVQLSVLREAAAPGEAALLTALEEAVRSRLLEELPGPRIAYRYRHELLRRAVIDRLPASRGAALHLRLARALQSVHGDDERAVSALALHFAGAADLGGREQAVRYSLRAAELATRSFAHEVAAGRLRAALDLGIDDDALRARALIDLGAALHRSARVPDALERYAAAAAIARELGDAALLAEAAIGFENVCWRPGIADPRTLELLEEAVVAVGGGDGALRVRLLAALSRARAYRGDHDAAAAIWEQAVAMARRVEDPRSLAVTLFHAAWTRGARSPEAVLASLDEARDLFGALGDDAFRLEVDGFRISLLFEAFDTHALHRELPRVRDDAERAGQPFYRHVITYFAATLAVCDGRLDEAEALARQAFELSRQFDEDASAIYGIQQFTIQRERDRLGAVAPLLRLVAAGDADGAWGPALALLEAELGMLEQARATLRRLCADDLAGVQRGGLWLGGLAYLADACALVGDPEVAETLYEEMRGLAGKNVVIGQAVACYGAADRHLGMLAATMGRLEDAERHFEAALEHNGRMASPTWTAHTQYELARALRRRGSPRDLARADELLADALATARAAGLVALTRRVEAAGAPSPQALELPDGLSAREVQVLRLVAGGCSNREIGSTLHISQHTAANHIRSILFKTGCANRTEAASYAHRHGLVAG